MSAGMFYHKKRIGSTTMNFQSHSMVKERKRRLAGKNRDISSKRKGQIINFSSFRLMEEKPTHETTIIKKQLIKFILYYTIP